MTGPLRAVATLLLLLFGVPAYAATREYYVTAELTEWDYAPKPKRPDA